MKIFCATDSVGQLLACVESNFKHLPSALPWVEPSINCLHQEAVLSFMIGNNESAIMSMCSLMEHVLRLAIINKDECGLKRHESISEIDKFNSLSKIIATAENEDIFSGCDIDWWKAVSKNIRNKAAHYLLPMILKNCAENEHLKHYVDKYDYPCNNEDWYYNKYVTDWGAFYYEAGRKFAINFLNDATEQLRIVIDNTNWSGDESWWESAKKSYDMFFSYKWSVENIKKSFENAYNVIKLE